MSNHDDLIRRGDALRVLQSGLGLTMGGQAKRIAALPAAQVAVKPLVWVERADASCRKGEFFTGHSLVSFAPVIAIHKTREGWWLNVDCKTYPSLEAAKAAAQADYAARIRAALEVEPAPDVARLVAEAAKEMLAAFYSSGNVTERHARACRAGVALDAALAAWEARND